MHVLLAALSDQQSAAVIAAAAGFAGAVLGALITVAVTFLIELRRDYASGMVAARIIRADLREAEGHPSKGPAWQQQRAALARILDNASWEAVERAYLDPDPANTTAAIDHLNDPAAGDFTLRRRIRYRFFRPGSR